MCTKAYNSTSICNFFWFVTYLHNFRSQDFWCVGRISLKYQFHEILYPSLFKILYRGLF